MYVIACWWKVAGTCKIDILDGDRIDDSLSWVPGPLDSFEIGALDIGRGLFRVSYI